MERTAEEAAVLPPEIIGKSCELAKKGKAFFHMLSSFAAIGAAGFGGGTALIPVIEREITEEAAIIDKRDFQKDVASACISPGALPVGIACGNGCRTFGIPGMLSAATAIAFPGALLTVLLVSFLSAGTGAALTVIHYISIGIGTFIISLLLAYTGKTWRNGAAAGRRHGIFYGAIILGIFALTGGSAVLKAFGIAQASFRLASFRLSSIEVLLAGFFIIFYTGGVLSWRSIVPAVLLSVLYVLTGGKAPVLSVSWLQMAVRLLMTGLATVGFVRSVRKDMEKGPQAVRADWKSLFSRLAAWAVFLVVFSLPAVFLLGGDLSYLGRGLFSSVISFGGGDAYLTVADGAFVSTGMIGKSAFYNTLVPVANVLPGSILCKILSGVGYFYGAQATGSTAGGFVTALCGFGVSVAGTGLTFVLVSWLFETFENITVFCVISHYIRPIIGGLLLTVAVSLLESAVSAGAACGAAPWAVIGLTLALAGLDLFLMGKKKVGTIPVMVLSAALGAGLLVLF